MPIRTLAIAVVVLIGAAWFVLRTDPETQVREAHAALLQAIIKSDTESVGATILNDRALRRVFAAQIEVSGDADGLTSVWTAEDLAGNIVRLRSLVERIELNFTELAISFPSDTEAVVDFVATLSAKASAEAIQPLTEQRHVTSFMREVDGEWRFAELRLVE